jgi:hypothetical protein
MRTQLANLSATAAARQKTFSHLCKPSFRRSREDGIAKPSEAEQHHGPCRRFRNCGNIPWYNEIIWSGFEDGNRKSYCVTIRGNKQGGGSQRA